MIQGKTWIAVIVALIVGFGAGFTLRPIIVAPSAPAATSTPPLAQAAAEPRSKSYFAAHLDEARQIVAGCQAGSVRGGECANAEQAVTEAEGKERFRRFMGK
ncbi:hypothetical protein [Stakelama tenebrarum]|uniref:Uncharacterized protein n=1 Tax=Stakelama tenebrarum TaxID=2711215 RepID=A0A6G6Y134_9SPHN|nr:hypothetical protein [Sphingosinithalassobacter tenebrarum]QIG78609.1 hypothetical protein G5C33_01610 [Sphingosinithalassobacter tenebrarum]